MSEKAHHIGEGVSKARSLAVSLGVPALISILVASGISIYGATRLENSKEQVASIKAQHQQFDDTQNAVITQLGLYTGRLFDGVDASKKDQLQSAIIAAQLQLLRISNAMKPEERDIISRYSAELDNLSKQLRTVSKPNDLGPVYQSVQKILSLHDQVAELLKSKSEIHIF